MTSEAQSELPLEGPGALPDRAEEGGAWLAAFLMAHPKGPGKGGAWPGRSICAKIGHPWNESSRRKLRAFREAAGRVIVSGQYGYQHAAHADLDTRRHAAARRLAQGRKMASEAISELRDLDGARKLLAKP